MGYNLNGYVVTDEDKSMYDYFGYSATCPKDIQNWIDSCDADQTLYINSYGGDMFAGAAIFAALNGKVDIVITGLAASIASVIAMAGRTVKMSTVAQIMIHNVSTYASGDYRDFQQTADELKNANTSIRNAYLSRSNLTDEALINLMDNETWLTAQQAKEYNFIDEILFDNNKFSNVNLSNAYSGAKAFYNSIGNPKQPKIQNISGISNIEPPKNNINLNLYSNILTNNINRTRSV